MSTELDFSGMTDREILSLKLKHHGPEHRPFPNQYVLVYCRQKYVRSEQRHSLLVQKPLDSKLHPGLWNYPGGKIKDGEKPSVAAVREFHEETGLDAQFPIYVGEITDLKSYVVYLFTVETISWKESRPAELPNRFFQHSDMGCRNMLVPNVPLLMALFSSGIRMFSILEDVQPVDCPWVGVDGLPYSGVHITDAIQASQLENDKAWRATIYGSRHS